MKTKKEKKSGRVWKAILKGVLNTFLTIMLIGLITGTIVGVALLIYLKDFMAIDYDIENLKLDLDQTSSVYYKDNETGEWVEWEEERIHGSENRLWVSLSEIPDNLEDAFIAIEDQRFWEHNGVDWRRTGGAILQVVKSGSFGYGGSTITQQLIKNVTGDKDVKIQRKLEEIFRALSLEKNRSKEEILEMYLNTIYLSQGCSGVQTAANLYFHKDVSELTLAECACIAAITNLPTHYDPIQNPDNNKYRRELILEEMEKQGKISKEEYEAAMSEELTFYTKDDVMEDEEEEGVNIHSWFVEAMLKDVINDLIEQKGLDENTATRLVYSGGLKIYSTIDRDVQAAMDEVFENEENYPVLEGIQPEAAMVVMEPYNGYVLGIVGGRGEKTANSMWNNATMSKRQPGSAFKPVAVYAQAIEEGIATYSTVVDDYPVETDPSKRLWPKNSPNAYRGYTTVCDALIRSVNTVAVRLLDEIDPINSFYFLRDKLRFTTLVEGTDGKGDFGLPMALGGLTYGVTVREITNAYATFANNGEFVKSRTYVKVLDSDGNIILPTKSQEKNSREAVFSPSTAQLMTNMLGEVANPYGYGTARKLTLSKTVDVAAKTGTTNDNKDIYFVGYTPYYVGGVWFGYEQPRYLPGFSVSPSLSLWDKVMTKLHEKYITEAKNGGEPLRKFDESTLIKYEYCRDSGLLAGEYCSLDPRGNRISTGYGSRDMIPSATCDKHVPVQWCTETKAVAGPGCPEDKLVTIALVRNEERVMERSVYVADAQYTYREVPSGYVYPTSINVPFYINLYTPGTYPADCGAERPINSWCVEHNHPEAAEKTEKAEKTE
ncbi:MAG: transglycosylase [Ruminococcaceae bacterium]|nr:transglycosylase [Oscillospiraceae bacterium]